MSEQDNCLILSDSVRPDDMAYFAVLAGRRRTGWTLAAMSIAPDDMMATNLPWYKPLSVWRDYFAGWIARPDPMAQLLASVCLTCA